MTMNDTWGFKSNDDNWKSTSVLIRNLVDIASKGGNYLLNVGPTSEGLIPGPSVERLKEVGKWMKVNGEAIHATTASPFKRLPWGRCTKLVSGSGATLYLHVFDWPSDGKLLVPGIKNSAEKAWLLADAKRKALEVTSGSEGLTIVVPSIAPDPISSTVVLKVKGPLEVAEPSLFQDFDGSAVLPAAEARMHGDQIRYESGAQRDNIGFWLNPADWADWELKVTKPGKFEVSAEVAAPEASSFAVTAGDQKLRAEAPVTGDYGKFKRVTIGTLELKSAGKVTIAVRAVAEGWRPINLKSLRLKPVAGGQ